ncbi:hypothetical protein AMTRI_Chr05g59320 [Amborella trichopoda]
MGAWMSREEEVEKKRIFILAGQSNMAGRGGVEASKWDRVVPSECRSDPLILRLNSGLCWELAKEPLHRDIDTSKTCGVGPAMSFAHALLNSSSPSPSRVPIGLVPCAIGGTAIQQWERGSHLYKAMISRAKAAARGSAIEGILWYQGESDTESRQAAEAYGRKMESFVRDVRLDLQLPNLPIIQVALASGTEPYMDIVREAQLGMHLPHVFCVDAKGLQLKKDNLHLTTPSQVQLGKMLADAYLNHCLF